MKATGIVRYIDNLGRVVIPIELRRTMRLGTEEPVEFYVEDDRVILKRYDAAGDMDQYLDNMARGIARSDMIPKEKIDGMLAKVEEMRALLTEG